MLRSRKLWKTKEMKFKKLLKKTNMKIGLKIAMHMKIMDLEFFCIPRSTTGDIGEELRDLGWSSLDAWTTTWVLGNTITH